MAVKNWNPSLSDYRSCILDRRPRKPLVEHAPQQMGARLLQTDATLSISLKENSSGHHNTCSASSVRSHGVMRGRSQGAPGQRVSGPSPCLSWISSASREVSDSDPAPRSCGRPLLTSPLLSPLSTRAQPLWSSESQASSPFPWPLPTPCPLRGCSLPTPDLHRTNPNDGGVNSSIIFSRGPFPTMSPKSATCSCLYHFIVSRTLSGPDIILFIYLFAALPSHCLSQHPEQLSISVPNK